MDVVNVCFVMNDKADFSSDFFILDFSLDFLRSNHLRLSDRHLWRSDMHKASPYTFLALFSAFGHA